MTLPNCSKIWGIETSERSGPAGFMATGIVVPVTGVVPGGRACTSPSAAGAGTASVVVEVDGSAAAPVVTVGAVVTSSLGDATPSLSAAPATGSPLSMGTKSILSGSVLAPGAGATTSGTRGCATTGAGSTAGGGATCGCLGTSALAWTVS